MKMRIIHAIDRPLHDLTVGDICRNAGISRQTFYNNFLSKDQAVSWWSAWCEHFYLDEIGRTLTWEVGYNQHMRLMYQESEFLTRVHKDDLDPPRFGTYPVSLRRKAIILTTLRDFRGIKVEPGSDLMFYVDSFTHIETVVFGHWCKEGLTLQPRDYARRMLGIVPPALYKAMQMPE